MLWTYITNTRKSNTRSIEIQKNNTLNMNARNIVHTTARSHCYWSLVLLASQPTLR